MNDQLMKLRRAISSRLPVVGRLVREREVLRNEAQELRAGAQRLETQSSSTVQFVPPGHFYSPIPSIVQVRERAARLFGDPPRKLPGIDLHEREQLELLDALQPFYDTLPFPDEKTPEFRYWYDNPSYSYSDAIFLHCLIRHLRPRRIVEVGSGYSSCVTLDTNERHFADGIECTFIEPYPELLRSLLRPGDEERITILPADAQSIPLETFLSLGANDILFIDSTHVSKIGSDVNYLILDVLPRLAAGVHVHFHDIFFPFEYPAEWIFEGRAWTEAYLLRAFLTFNVSFEVVLFNTFLERFHEERFRARMPLCLRNAGGSIWLKRQA